MKQILDWGEKLQTAKKTYHLHLSDKFSDIKERVTTKIEKKKKLWEARAWNMKGVLENCLKCFNIEDI